MPDYVIFADPSSAVVKRGLFLANRDSGHRWRKRNISYGSSGHQIEYAFRHTPAAGRFPASPASSLATSGAYQPVVPCFFSDKMEKHRISS